MQEGLNLLKTTIDEICKNLRIKPSVVINHNNEIYFVDIQGDDLNFLIGFRGSALSSLQHYLELVLYKKSGAWSDVVVDINGYLGAKREKIQDMTKNFIDRVRFFAKEIALPPMPAYERKQVHEFVNEYDDIASESVGEGFDRHVVLKPADEASNKSKADN